MGFRTVNGNTASENGWPLVDQGSCTWITVPGTSVSLQIQSGQPAQILGAWAADFNAYVEPLRDADSASWTEGNSVLGQPGKNNGSNHLGGTAEDLNWNSHRFQISYDGFNPAQIATIREMLDFYEDTVFWGQDWGGNPYDCMHFQMGYDTYWNPHTADFINRKIRPDGFSTFRRGAAPSVDAVQVLSDAMGGEVSLERYGELFPAVSASLTFCDCTTVDRIAMWCAQLGEESGGLQWMEELGSGAEYEGRSDLGNTQPGDGVRFKGRGPIQITGRSNYQRLSMWAYSQGLIPSPTYFIDQPAQLASDEYGFVGVDWYWTVARNMNSYADNADILGATRAVNGGTNGLQDRTDRWNRCRAMGQQLLTLTENWDSVYAELMGTN